MDSPTICMLMNRYIVVIVVLFGCLLKVLWASTEVMNLLFKFRSIVSLTMIH